MSAGREIPVPGYLAGKPPAFFEGIAKRYEARYKADKEATTLLKKWDRYARHANKARTRKKYAGMLRRYIKANRCPATQEAMRIFREWAGVWRSGDAITDGEKIFLPSTFELFQPMSYPDRRPFTVGGYWWLRQSYTAGIYAPQYSAATPEEHRRVDPYLNSALHKSIGAISDAPAKKPRKSLFKRLLEFLKKE